MARRGVCSGVQPIAPVRTAALLSHIEKRAGIYFMVAPGTMLDNFIAGMQSSEQEVLDIEEDAFRKNILDARHPDLTCAS